MMLNSWKLLFSLSFLTFGTTAASVVEVFAYIGGKANVSCSYPHGYESYEKYLCTSNCGEADVLVTTQQRSVTRYSISDDEQSHIFTVTIANIKKSDAGQYWCGVSKAGKDIYTEVKVHVQSDVCCDSDSSIHAYESNMVSMSCPFQSEHINSFKYMCRGSDLSMCRQQALVTTNTRQSRRFTLKEAQSEFTVELTGVKMQDTGSYLCGIQRDNDYDVFSRVNLTVTEWCCVNSRDLKGLLGQSVTLQCPYPAEHRSNRKFLCKGESRSTCETVVTSTEFTDRFRLQDERSSSFSVTITELREADAGTYWCGSDSQWTPGKYYTKIRLSLEYLKSTLSPKKTTNTTGYELNLNKGSDAAISNIVLYVLPGLLVILAVVTSVIVYRSCCVRAQGDQQRNNISRGKENIEDIAVNELYCNKADVSVPRVNDYCNRDDRSVPENEVLYENFGDTNIYNNC